MALKFLHAADIHLGRPFSGLTRTSATLGRLFREAGYAAWGRIVDAAVDHGVHFVTLAGDVFDNSNPTVRSRVVFRDGLQRLQDAGIPVYMALGNHDPLISFPHSIKTLPGLHVFGGDPEARRLDTVESTPGVVIFGASFQKAAVIDNLARKFRRDPGIDVAIGVLHANVAGDWGHKNYAPCTIGDLTMAGMDVWCLGHVHSPTVLSEDPLIFYPGTAQGAHINESGRRGCSVVTVDRDGAHLERIDLAPVRWERVELDVAGLTDMDHLLYLAEEACSRFGAEQDSLHAVVARFNLTGCNSLEVVRSVAEENEFLELLSERLGLLSVPVFPESVRDATRASIDLEALMTQEGFLGDCLRLCRECAQDPDLRDEALEWVHGKLSKNLGRRFLAPDVDPDSLKDNPVAAAQLFNRCAELLVQMFLERAEGGT
jgi:DNA repair protein SbcD/Mre11